MNDCGPTALDHDMQECTETIARLQSALRCARPYIFQRIYPVGHPSRDWRSEVAEDVLKIVDAELPTRNGAL